MWARSQTSGDINGECWVSCCASDRGSSRASDRRRDSSSPAAARSFRPDVIASLADGDEARIVLPGVEHVVGGAPAAGDVALVEPHRGAGGRRVGADAGERLEGGGKAPAGRGGQIGVGQAVAGGRVPEATGAAAGVDGAGGRFLVVDQGG